MGPTVILLQSGGFIFGGYASTSWNTSQIAFGTPSSFLFSLTRNTKVPAIQKEGVNPIYLWASPTSFTFGKVDLCLEVDSQLE